MKLLNKQESLLATLKIKGFSLLKIPLIFFCQPKVIELNEEACSVLIPLNYRTRNHLKSMYFGVLAVGADLAGGLSAMTEIEKSKRNISLVFKNFQANFLRRPTDDVIFRCEMVPQIKNLVQKTIHTKEREELALKIYAFENKNHEDKVAEFILTLSLKCRD